MQNRKTSIKQRRNFNENHLKKTDLPDLGSFVAPDDIQCDGCLDQLRDDHYALLGMGREFPDDGDLYGGTYGFKMADSSAFSVAEFPALDGTVGFEHSLGIAGFMKVSYYDYGDDMVNSAVLTINLDHDDALAEMAMLTIFYTILAGDLDTTEEEYEALVEAMCPIFYEVFSGQEHVNGSQAATLRGVGYAMEVNDDERFIRLYTNVSLTQNED